MTAVKICGITRPEDAEAAARFGASYIGFVLWPNSPRAASLDIVTTIVRVLAEGVTRSGVRRYDRATDHEPQRGIDWRRFMAILPPN